MADGPGGKHVVSQVAIIGGSVAGLGAAIGLAAHGIGVTIIERDPGPTTESGDEAFLTWRRPGVTQFRQGHGFSARARTLLLTHAPTVVERLRADGVEEMNFFRLLAPKELWNDADDDYTNLWTRRPGFELALRRYVEDHAGIDLVSPAAVAGLEFASGTPRRVTGLRLDDGTLIEADCVLDGGGRRSPVPRWLAEVGVDVPYDEQDCDGTYIGRYYRRNPESPLSPLTLIGNANGTPRLQFNSFPGDHDTFGLVLVIKPDDRELHALRNDAVFDAVLEKIPSLAAWGEPEHGTPLHGVEMMAGNRNRRFHYVVDDEPLVLGLIPIGDALCATNPFYGWGASMALTYAFEAADAIAAHDDLRDAALAYEAAIEAEADGVYRASAAADRRRYYESRNIEIPEWDRAEMERQALIGCIAAGATRDEVLGRAFLRRTGLLESPDVVLDDPEVVEHACKTQRILASKAPRKIGPDDDELAAILARARTPRHSARSRSGISGSDPALR